MNIKQQILQVQRKINELRQNTKDSIQSNLNEDNEIISKNIKKLNNLEQRYQQLMLSKIVKNGIEDKETSRWWMNRY